MNKFRQIFSQQKPILGMIHLPPLPGYAGSPGIDRVIEQAIADLKVLEEGGVDGVLVENEYDRPHRITAAPETVAAMTRVTHAVVIESRRTIVGCEILLHDPRASLAVAKMSGAQFIRTDYFVDAMTRPDYGEFEIDAEGLIDYRSAIEADDIAILADIQVKYAKMIVARPLAESAAHASKKGADAVVVTGDSSGDAPSVTHLQSAATGTHDFAVPVLIGSGLKSENAAALIAECDGAIVGTSLMRDGCVDASAVAMLMTSLGRA